ncbi:MAG TPA: LPS export ABC transporter periplasmic protein LptC [Firmicutes bacterium]|nr:LPS export ABC transporter periplasmic protein LptC [Bacillota bacterium]
MRRSGVRGWLGPAAVLAAVAAVACLLAAAAFRTGRLSGRPVRRPAPPLSQLSSAPREGPPPVGEARPRPPGLYFQDFHLVGRDRGEKQWELEVAAVEAPKEREEVGFRVVRRGTVFRDRRPYLFLAADGGTYRPARNEFTLRGDVVVSRPNGDLLRTAALHWDPVARRAASEGPVEAKVEGIWFRADRLTVDVDSETVTAAGRVELVQEDGQRLTGETVVYSLADAAWEIEGTAELALPLGDDQTYVAPGLGGKELPQPAQGRERR